MATLMARTGEAADRVRGTRRIGEQVEPRARVPGVAGQDLRRTQHQAPLQAGAGVVEDLVEHVTQGQHGGTDIDPRAPDRRLTQLAARPGRRLQQRHREAGAREIECRHQAADPGSDDDRPRHPHHPCPQDPD